MTLTMAAVFYALLIILAAFYCRLVVGANASTSRLSLNQPEATECLEAHAEQPPRLAGAKDRVRSEWLVFSAQYSVLLGLLLLSALLWAIWQTEILNHSVEAARLITAKLPALSIVNLTLPFPILIAIGLLPIWLGANRYLKGSLAYPFVIFHILLVLACCVSDLLGINSQLNPVAYSESALKWIVFLIVFSQAIWAVSYPRPLKALPAACIGLIFSISAAIAAFIFINLFSHVESPTLVAFTVYISFGYGVFGSHLWTLSKISRTVV